GRASRWNGGLAQAIEAKHGLTIRDDPGTSSSLTGRRLYSAKNYDSVVGASGTAGGKGEIFAKQGLPSSEVSHTPRYYESRLEVRPDKVYKTVDEKLDGMAADIAAMQRDSGKPQWVVMDDNALVRQGYDKTVNGETVHVKSLAERLTDMKVD